MRARANRTVTERPTRSAVFVVCAGAIHNSHLADVGTEVAQREAYVISNFGRPRRGVCNCIMHDRLTQHGVESSVPWTPEAKIADATGIETWISDFVSQREQRYAWMGGPSAMKAVNTSI